VQFVADESLMWQMAYGGPTKRRTATLCTDEQVVSLMFFPQNVNCNIYTASVWIRFDIAF
jgi:hypothetical protein